jgi:hypothetical protein
VAGEGRKLLNVTISICSLAKIKFHNNFFIFYSYYLWFFHKKIGTNIAIGTQSFFHKPYTQTIVQITITAQYSNYLNIHCSESVLLWIRVILLYIKCLIMIFRVTYLTCIYQCSDAEDFTLQCKDYKWDCYIRLDLKYYDNCKLVEVKITTSCLFPPKWKSFIAEGHSPWVL